MLSVKYIIINVNSERIRYIHTLRYIYTFLWITYIHVRFPQVYLINYKFTKSPPPPGGRVMEYKMGKSLHSMCKKLVPLQKS